MTLGGTIAKLTDYACKRLCLPRRDEAYARNRLLSIAGEESFAADGETYEGERISELLRAFTGALLAKGRIREEECAAVADEAAAALMLPPSAVEKKFARLKRVSPERAMRWLYEYSVDADYVKKELLDANPRFTAENGLIVTINLAKPEFRDPKTAVSSNSTKGGYPPCTICRENEGFGGRNKRTLRTVSLRLCNEDWFWQFSPYGYFYEHGIAVNTKHTPMRVGKDTFYKLMEFVDQFPQFFIGCNAPLPRIGGSVLAHDHFQGGGERLPLFDAPAVLRMRHAAFPKAEIGVLGWFGTAVRVTGDRGSVAELCELIRAAWERYEEKPRGIVPEDENGRHNAVSPTVVKGGAGYEMTLLLRSNITSEQYPDGVFHAHPEYHVIKKESIGLIEAQGLFILPGRLVEQLKGVRTALTEGTPLPEELREFQTFFGEIRAEKTHFTAEEADAAIKKELGSVCERILKNTAVFPSPQDTAEFLKGIGLDEI